MSETEYTSDAEDISAVSFVLSWTILVAKIRKSRKQYYCETPIKSMKVLELIHEKWNQIIE